jgi:pimeloyl-ACP methyl ester carboxylesterase
LLVGLGGSEGGNAWASEAWTAQRERFLAQGYALLAVGYFGLPETPAALDRISLDAIADAIDRAAADPRLDGRCIVLIGGSKGAELALSLAAREPRVRGVVALVPGDAVFAGLTAAMTTSSWTWHGEPLPFLPVPWSATPALIAGDLRRVFDLTRDALPALPEAAIPVEHINGPILFLSATQDELWPSRAMADAMMQRLDAIGFAHVHRHVAIEGGHTAPLDHFAEVERFLAENFGADEPCADAPGPG